ncbi:uncharacterized protein LOC142335343 [Convolutriloba macropyga]|uniref:uncharacterized protein LOC142335343 n=1 Tax=Convolutriloba macropyga TaxID=536237 RepID=UPI003F51DA6E
MSSFDLYNFYLAMLSSPQNPAIPPLSYPQLPSLYKPADYEGIETEPGTVTDSILDYANSISSLPNYREDLSGRHSQSNFSSMGESSVSSELSDHLLPISGESVNGELDSSRSVDYVDVVECEKKRKPIGNDNCDEEGTMPLKKKYSKTLPGEFCRICEDVASGVHFGIFCCEGCKRFFQRAIVGGIKKLFCKTGGNNCDVSGANRTKCKFCRFNRCVQMGMSSSMIKLGRDARKQARAHPQPNPDENLASLVTKLSWNNPTLNETPASEPQSKDSGSTINSSDDSGCDFSGHCSPSNSLDVSFHSSKSTSPSLDGFSNPRYNSPSAHYHADRSRSPTPQLPKHEEASSQIDTKDRAILDVFKLYISNLYKTALRSVLDIIRDPESSPRETLEISSEAVVSFIAQIPGINLKFISNNQSVKTQFQDMCTHLVRILCSSAVDVVRSDSDLNFEQQHEMQLRRLEELIESNSESNTRRVGGLKETFEAFAFLYKVLDVLEKLGLPELNETTRVLKLYSQSAYQ